MMYLLLPLPVFVMLDVANYVNNLCPYVWFVTGI